MKADTIKHEKEAFSRINTLFSNAVASIKSYLFITLLFLLLWSSNILTTLILPKKNNQGFIALVQNSVFYACTKYINIQPHYIQDKLENEKIDLQYIPI